ncbi:MAG: hypothetical protein FWF69_02945 [Firmicutes bacterium]|nr:hypothetical protein [Bacillota bacterium]
MNRTLAGCWRFILILIVYLALAVPVVGLVLPGPNGMPVQIPMLLQGVLRGAAYRGGYIPDSVYYEDWQAFVSAYAMNCLYLSLLLVLLWNLLYARFALGRNHENSARLSVWIFAAAHALLLLAYAFYVFTLSPHIWNWLIRQPMRSNLALLLPQLLVLPFYLSARALCPYRVYHVFPLFGRLRGRLFLRVYSKRGAY